MRPRFTNQQRQELLRLGLYLEQVKRLQSFLPSISAHLARPPPMGDVLEKLSDLAKASVRVERLYERISTLGTGASAEASTRLILAEEAVAGPDKLLEVLETASRITIRALNDLQRTQRTTRRDSAHLIRLIVKALEGGYAEYFACRGEPLPRFPIDVTRTREGRRKSSAGKKIPFASIADIVAEATGCGWSVDDAIRAYQRMTKPRVNLYRRRRHPRALSKRGVVTETLLVHVRGKQAPK